MMVCGLERKKKKKKREKELFSLRCLLQINILLCLSKFLLSSFLFSFHPCFHSQFSPSCLSLVLIYPLLSISIHLPSASYFFSPRHFCCHFFLPPSLPYLFPHQPWIRILNLGSTLYTKYIQLCLCQEVMVSSQTPLVLKWIGSNLIQRAVRTLSSSGADASVWMLHM